MSAFELFGRIAVAVLQVVVIQASGGELVSASVRLSALLVSASSSDGSLATHSVSPFCQRFNKRRDLLLQASSGLQQATRSFIFLLFSSDAIQFSNPASDVILSFSIIFEGLHSLLKRRKLLKTEKEILVILGLFSI